MNKSLMFLFLLVITVTSCKSTQEPTELPLVLSSSTASPSTSPTATPSPTPPASPTLSSTPTTTPSTTSTASPTLTSTSTPLPTLVPVSVEVLTLCPKDRVVPLNELGLDQHSRLIVLPWDIEYYETETGYSLISPKSPIPRLVPNLIPPGMITRPGYSFGISPDGRWVEFPLQEKGSVERTIWISSLDGEQKWAISPTSEHSAGRWIAPQRIMIYGPEENARKIINPFTMEEYPLSELSEEGIETMPGYFLELSNHPYEFYEVHFSEYIEFGLFDHSNQTSRLVFQWLSSDDIYFPDTSIVHSPQGIFMAMVVRVYGIDISPEMDIDEIGSGLDYSQIMRPVLMPEEILPVWPSIFSPSIQAITMNSWGETPSFYLFDYKNMVVKDYCFDLEGMDISKGFSPSNKFYAFTRRYYPSFAPVPKSIIVLNLETGYMTQIDDYEFLGWGWEDD